GSPTTGLLSGLRDVVIATHPRQKLNGRCQLTPYRRPLVFAHRGPGVFARMRATCFHAIGGQSLTPDRELLGPPCARRARFASAGGVPAAREASGRHRQGVNEGT